MKNISSIKKVLYFFTLLTSWITNSQVVNKEIEEPNCSTTDIALFYKNTTKPFSGNLKIETDYKSEPNILKVKFNNGLCVLQEFTNLKSKKLVLKITQPRNRDKCGIQEKYDSINLKTEFVKSDVFIDTSRIQKKMVTNYFRVDKNSTKIEKLNGFIKYDKTKLYFIDGMKVKVEYFYDDDLKKIKESYEIFRTEIGNFNEDGLDSYKTNFYFEGVYLKWDQNGKIIERGTYKAGAKI